MAMQIEQITQEIHNIIPQLHNITQDTINSLSKRELVDGHFSSLPQEIQQLAFELGEAWLAIHNNSNWMDEAADILHAFDSVEHTPRLRKAVELSYELYN